MINAIAKTGVACLTAALCLALGSCGLFSTSLETRANSYYAFMVGLAPGAKYSSFISPAYRQTFDRSSLAILDEARGVGKTVNKRYPKTGAKDIATSTRDSFAYSLVNPALGDAYAAMSPVRWVKAGRSWYLFLGSDAEIGAYGEFPRELSPPTSPWQEGADDSAAETPQQ